jgi:hypothetical protein
MAAAATRPLEEEGAAAVTAPLDALQKGVMAFVVPVDEAGDAKRRIGSKLAVKAADRK